MLFFGYHSGAVTVDRVVCSVLEQRQTHIHALPLSHKNDNTQTLYNNSIIIMISYCGSNTLLPARKHHAKNTFAESCLFLLEMPRSW